MPAVATGITHAQTRKKPVLTVEGLTWFCLSFPLQGNWGCGAFGGDPELKSRKYLFYNTVFYCLLYHLNHIQIVTIHCFIPFRLNSNYGG
jgi:hypothetical protein